MEKYYILGASLIVIASYFFNLLSKRTNIPSVLMLMVLGYILSHALEYFGLSITREELKPALGVLGTVGVILIVLEAALDLHLSKDKWPIIWRSLVLSIALLLATSFLIAMGLQLFYPMETFQAWLYAVPLAVMSSAIIIPSVQGLSEKAKEFLVFESAFSDIFGIILFYTLLGMIGGEGDAATTEVGGTFFAQQAGLILLTIFIGFFASYVLILVFQNLKGHIKLFLLIAVLMALYTTGKLFHLSSLLIILIFGLVINNKNIFFPGNFRGLIDDENFGNVLKDFKVITLETAFVVRTFFFVAFGMFIKMGELLYWQVWIVSIIALLAIYATRYIGLKGLYAKKITPEIYVAPRGLITVLLFFTIPVAFESVEFHNGILLLTILVTSLIMTFGLVRNKPDEEEMEGEEGDDTPDKREPSVTATLQ